MKFKDITLADVSTEAKVETLGIVLDKTLSDLTSKVDSVTKAQGPKGDKGDKGDRGPKGPAGIDGKDGLNGLNGKDGKDGIDGKDGSTGVSVENAYVALDGSLVLQLSNGNEIDAGEVVGPAGPGGMNGQVGPQGPAGSNGAVGAGVAPGGTTGQVLAKVSNTDYDTEWVDASTGGGGITVETDPIYTASSWYTTTNNASNWNTAYGWGNHASAGYLDSADIGVSIQAYDANIANYTDSNAHFTGNLEVDGNVQIDGNLTVSGTTTTVTAQNLAVSDNMIYLNNAIQTTISNAVGNGSSVTYTTSANHNYLAGMTVTVTGITPSSLNISGATITGVTANTFTVTSSVTDTYVSGGTGRAKSNANPDLGIAGSYNDGTYHHAGIFRDTTDDRWKVFHNYTPEPDASAYIDTSHASFELSDFQAKDIYGALKGNADTVTNGVYTTGTYADPAWITSLSGSKISGNISGNAANITGTYAGTLTSSQITTGLGYTPYDSTNPNGYTSNAGTVTSVSGTGTVNGITLTGSVTSSGSLTLGGTLGNIANSQLTNSAITINGSSVSLGGTASVGTVTSVGGTGTVSGLTLSGTVTSSGNLTLGGTLSATSSNISDFSTAVDTRIGATSINSLSDVVITSPSNTQVLTYNGTNWVNQTPSSSGTLLAESTSVFTTGSAQTYTAPANTQWVKVTVVGPGGNGGAATNQRATGGGGGAVAIKWLAMNAGQTLTYTVGTASGTASTVSSGTLTITTISAGSGTNGAGTAYAASVTAGAAGGTATGGDINITGGQSRSSYGSSTTVLTNFSGAGGDCPGFGVGGPAVGCVATAGVQGNGYGAGGGGAHGSNTSAAGRGGIIIFEAY